MANFNPDEFLTGNTFNPDEFLSSKPDFMGASVIEPVMAVGSGAARSITGGLAGTLQALNPFAEDGEGARTVKEFTEGSFTPETEAGKQGLETLGALVQGGIDIVNFPISGLAGLTELISGQGLEQATATIKSIQDKGVSTTAGQRVFEETGSPLAATIAEVAPQAALDIIGLKGANRVVEQASTQVPRALSAIEDVVTPLSKEAIKSTKELPKAIFNFQTPTKQRIGKLIESGSTDAETARFTASSPPKPTSKLGKFLDSGGPKVKADKVAVGAINQGFDEGVIAAIKGADPIDKTKMLEMVEVMENAKKNAKFAATNRPSDVAGNTLIQRYKSVVSANKEAGKDLDGVAKSLKGQPVDFDPAVNSFLDDLDSMGVTLDDKLKPIFKGSDIEGGSPEARTAQSIIKTTIDRMSDTKVPDAFDLHRLKRFIDSQVTFGKTKSGLPGGSERILKSLRKNLDDILDENFAEYNRVNTTFSETIGAIDSLQDVAGRKLNLSGANAEKATGTLLRRLMSNAQSRVALLDSVNQIEGVALKFGGGNLPKIEGQVIKGLEGKSDLMTQILFVDELDRVFGPVARTSFQGQIDQALKQGVNAATTKQGAIDLAISGAAKVAEKARGINQEGAFKSIKELLKETK